MKVPRPEYASTRPFSRNVLTASRTAVRLTPRRCAKSRSAGSWSPGLSEPLRTDSSIWWTICSYRREVRTTLYTGNSPALASWRELALVWLLYRRSRACSGPLRLGEELNIVGIWVRWYDG